MYVFTEQKLELAPFAKTLATGPEDPFKNWHCVHCLICKKIISMKSRGLYGLQRHFQREQKLWFDQRFRARYHASKVRGSDGRSLCGTKSEAEQDNFMHLDVADSEQKHQFYYDVIERKPFTFTPESSRVLTQIELLLIFLKGGGQLWTLEEYWSEMCVLTGIQQVLPISIGAQVIFPVVVCYVFVE